MQDEFSGVYRALEKYKPKKNHTLKKKETFNKLKEIL